MTSKVNQLAGVKRTWHQQVARITCDGGNILTDYICRDSTPVEGTTAADARNYARRQGWAVFIKNPKGRKRLDYCPVHRTLSD